MFLDVNIQHWLEVIESSVLDNTQHPNERIEYQIVHLTCLVNGGKEYPKQGVEDVSQELRNFDLTRKRELWEHSWDNFLIFDLLPIQEIQEIDVLCELGWTQRRPDYQVVP